MENPLLVESPLPYGAPQFDKIKNEHYLPAFEQGIKEGKAEIDAIVSNPEAPTFANTIEALEYSGETLDRVAGIFYNILEADTDEQKQAIAEQVAPMMTEYEMYISLNDSLFSRVKEVYAHKDELGLESDQMRLLEKTYKGFVRGGANLSPEDKAQFGKLQERLSLLQLQFGKNALGATNAYKLNITDEADLEGLPQFVRDMGAATAAENGQEGWTFDLTYPSYSPFMQYSSRRDLRKQLYMQSVTKAVGGEFDNTDICRQIVDARIRIANMLGYETFADYAVEDRMIGSVAHVRSFMKELLDPSLPAAHREIADILAYARENGFGEDELQGWDLAYWSERYKDAFYSLNDSILKPYFKLENCIEAVLGLATRLYGISFEERTDIPVYHKDVKVFDVKDADGRHLALYYVDFFPRASKRSGAWMTEFRGQSIRNGVENRPFVSIVTNFSKPTENAPSLLTHYELTTFLHEFGHSLHGMLAEGRYGSLAGTNVDHDFVELPSQIMENWGYEKEYLKSFARHYETGEVIPDELIDRIVASKNYMVAYGQVRQLQFGTIDMAWYNRTSLPEEGTVDFEKSVLAGMLTIPSAPGACSSTTFGHIFSNGYCAGYYSYKWAEVLAADAYSLFEEKGVFNTEVSGSFRANILSKGSSEDEATLYRRFRGHDPETRALLEKQEIIK
ncbi:MAG: M3 family metallopeptidase [Bacteroidales bacterium]|nr:M3 family metallopeptidase [Bacteroidales bacterium]